MLVVEVLELTECVQEVALVPDKRTVQRFMTVRLHPAFHPLYGRDLEFVAHRQNWGEDRVHLRDENGQLFSLPAGWTDVVAPDPFVSRSKTGLC